MNSSNRDFKNVTASYFGATAVSVGNALQLRKDSLLTQGITVLFIIIFLGIYFGRKRAPFIILIPVLFGACIFIGGHLFYQRKLFLLLHWAQVPWYWVLPSIILYTFLIITGIQKISMN